MFLPLIESALTHYENKRLNIKLWNRFWQANNMYANGATYQEVLEALFGAKSTLTKSHKKNIHFNYLIKHF